MPQSDRLCKCETDIEDCKERNQPSNLCSFVRNLAKFCPFGRQSPKDWAENPIVNVLRRNMKVDSTLLPQGARAGVTEAP
jgi:hypothetical protein